MIELLKRLAADVSLPVGTVVSNTLTQAQMKSLFPWMTWQAYAQGRVLVGTGSNISDGTTTMSFSLGGTGGEFKHKLTTAETPVKKHGHGVTDSKHSHSVYGTKMAGSAGQFAYGMTATNYGTLLGTTDSKASNVSVNETENTTANTHNNIQPYKVVNFWQRTA